MSTPVVDFSKMSKEELLVAAGGYLGIPVEQPEPGQPRDEQGRFVAAEPEVPETPEVPEVPEGEVFEAVAEKEVDLGDGSGVQLFRGTGQGATQDEANLNAYEALAEEFAKAQTNATRKIQELSRAAKAAPAPETPITNPDEEAQLTQRLMAEPTKVFREMQERAVKEAEQRIREQQEAAQRTQESAHNAAVSFMQATPDFHACPENQQRIEKLMKLNNLPLTTEGITQAYNELKADGLIVQKPAAAPARTRSSGISVRGSAAPPARPAADVSKMTREQLFEAAGGYQNRY